MIPFFDINNYFAITHLPSYRRTTKFIQWIRGLLGMSTLRDSIFRRYMDGSDDLPFYDSTFTYKKYDRIKNNFAVYESKTDNNLNNPTTDQNNWLLVLDSYIGKNEYVSYTSRKLQFEYALNHYFQQQLINNGFVGWKQPTSIVGSMYSPVSDIYIDTLAPVAFSFIGFSDIHLENAVTDGIQKYAAFDNMIYKVSSYYQSSINIPLAVYNSLGTTDGIRDSVINNFIKNIIKSGTNYKIVKY